MTTTTVLARNFKLGRDYQIDGWYGFINNGEYTDDQQAALVEALMDAQESAFDEMLPDGCHWLPYVSEIQGPVGTSLEDLDLDDLLEQAGNAASARFDEIEAEAIGAGRGQGA